MSEQILQDVSNLQTRRTATLDAIARHEEAIVRLQAAESDALIQEALGRASLDLVREVQQQIAEEENWIAEAKNRVAIFDDWLAEQNLAVKQAKFDQMVAKYQIDAKVQASALAAMQRWLNEARDVITAYARSTSNCDWTQTHIADLAAELGIEPPDLDSIEKLPSYPEMLNTFEKKYLEPLRSI
jgi:hypothetical protein